MIIALGQKGIMMDELISRKKAIQAAIKGADPYYADSIEDEINRVPSVGKCFVAEDIIKWLLGYYIQTLKLRGRYPPHEVITWVINDMTKTLFNEGEQDG